MYRQVITPDKNNHSIELPEELLGKQVEVIVVGDREGKYRRGYDNTPGRGKS